MLYVHVAIVGVYHHIHGYCHIPINTVVKSITVMLLLYEYEAPLCQSQLDNSIMLCQYHISLNTSHGTINVSTIRG